MQYPMYLLTAKQCAMLQLGALDFQDVVRWTFSPNRWSPEKVVRSHRADLVFPTDDKHRSLSTRTIPRAQSRGERRKH